MFEKVAISWKGYFFSRTANSAFSLALYDIQITVPHNNVAMIVVLWDNFLSIGECFGFPPKNPEKHDQFHNHALLEEKNSM